MNRWSVPTFRLTARLDAQLISLATVLSLSMNLPGCGASGSPTAVASGSSTVQPPAASAQPKGLESRLIVGYQAWFGCPGDGPGAARWRHWFDGTDDIASSLTVDMLPDVSNLPAAALCPTSLRRADGRAVTLYSSRSDAVIDQHFAWMAAHGIDGAAVQRFIGPMRDAVERERSDDILSKVRDAAERHGRIFYLTYDISGADAATVYDDIRSDWHRLAVDMKLTDSPAYLRQKGSPMLQLWGFGFRDRPGEPDRVLALLADLRRAEVPRPAAVVIGGVPAQWRTLTGDAKDDPAWSNVYLAYDVLSPWAVGRYEDAASDQRFVHDVLAGDVEETGRLGIGYLPVIFPGFSWANLMTVRGQSEQAIPNRIPRRCGDFLWAQGVSRLAAGSRSLFVAMFDEVDEGTAIMPVEPGDSLLPDGTRLLGLDADGCKLPSDWYLRVTGQIADHLRRGEPPPSALSTVLPR